MWVFEKELIKSKSAGKVRSLAYPGIFLLTIIWAISWLLPPYFSDPLFIQFALIAGPVSFFGAWVGLFMLTIFKGDYPEKEQFKLVFPYIMIMGLGVTFSALIMNSNLLYILEPISYVFEELGLNIDYVTFFEIGMVVVLGPLVEEIVKIVPIILLANSEVKRLIRDKETNELIARSKILIGSRRLFIFYGVITGTMFVIFETYFYIFVYTPDPFGQHLVVSYLQLSLRTYAPLHVFAAAIASMGVYHALEWNKSDNRFSFSLSKLLPFFMIAWIAHGFWNYQALYADIPFPDKLGYPIFMPVFGTMGIVLNIGLFALWYISWKEQVDLCPRCGKQLVAKYCPCEEEKVAVRPTLPRRAKIKEVNCRYCKEPLTNYSRCDKCGYKTALMACSICHAPLNLESEVCTQCLSPTTTATDFIYNRPYTMGNVIEIGIAGIIIAALLPLSINAFSVGTVSARYSFLILFMSLGFVPLAIGYWLYHYGKMKGFGLILIRSILFSVFASFSITLMGIGLSGLLSLAIDGRFILSGLFIFGVQSYLAYLLTVGFFRRYIHAKTIIHD
ncbi:MAG: PrsW family intramembrane metalloprotease [Candidatus Heimdallarchaeota archaeon]|nr:PrsW family intramembrane metalloprotease [Candidatus Heimdallarchaeota archaeon]MCK5047783.1 PrsW family intramembrane metalloprotease [Candidatus Heimdallarchaeota archaeon]